MLFDLPWICGTDHAEDVAWLIGPGSFLSRHGDVSLATEPNTGRRMIRFGDGDSALLRPIPAVTDLRVGFRHVSHGPFADSPILAFSDGNGDEVASLYLTASGRLQVRRDHMLILEDSAPNAPNEPHYIEVSFHVGEFTRSGSFTVRSDGRTLIGASMRLVIPARDCEMLRFGGLHGAPSFITDIYASDGAEFYGPCVVESLPAAAGRP